METIELKLDEQNDLSFKVVVEGSKENSVKVRLVLEDKEMSLSFPGYAGENGTVSVDVPPLKKILAEGIYGAKLEIITEERFFEPLAFNVDLKNSIQISEASISQVNENKISKTAQPKQRKRKMVAASIITQNHEPRKTKRSSKKVEPTIRESAKSIKSSSSSKTDIKDANVRRILQDLISKGRL